MRMLFYRVGWNFEKIFLSWNVNKLVLTRLTPGITVFKGDMASNFTKCKYWDRGVLIGHLNVRVRFKDEKMTYGLLNLGVLLFNFKTKRL